jgi:hypothetical protein
METTVQVLNYEYRAAGDARPPGPMELAHDVRAHLAPALSEGLELALGSDPTVYVVRRVECELTLRCDAGGAPQVARRLAPGIANAVLRTLRDAPAADVVTFPDEAELAVQFIVDLLDGQAHERWYYSSLGHTQAEPPGEAVARVLMAPQHGGMRALARLSARGQLERVLRELSPSVLAELAPGEVSEADVLRPMLAAALALAEDVVAPVENRERLLQRYAGTGPPPPDWRDQRSLAAGVVQALRFVLATQSLLVPGASARARMQVRVADLDWLDRSVLLDGLADLVPEVETSPVVSARRTERSPRFSAAQRMVLADLAKVCALRWPGIDGARGDCAENRVRVQAALAARSEAWADDPVAGELVAALLRELAAGGSRHRPLMHELADLGAAPARRELEGGTAGAPRPKAGAETEPTTAADAVPSDYAGIALLVRAGLEVRLGALGQVTGFLSPPHAVAGSLMALAGPRAWDPAAALILGAAPAEDPPVDDHARQAFEHGLLRTLAARGLLGGELCLASLPAGHRTLLLGGVEEPAIWPLTQLVDDADDVAQVLRRWSAEWADATTASHSGLRWIGDPEGPAHAFSPLIESGDAASSHGLSANQATLAAMGLVLLRAWGRWLPGLGRSSLRYLFDHFVQRPGTASRNGDDVLVVLERRPLDAVLELSGALAEIDARRQLGVIIRFELLSS